MDLQKGDEEAVDCYTQLRMNSVRVVDENETEMGRRRAQEGIVFQYKGGDVMARPSMECVNAVRGGCV